MLFLVLRPCQRVPKSDLQMNFYVKNHLNLSDFFSKNNDTTLGAHFWLNDFLVTSTLKLLFLESCLIFDVAAKL